MLFAAVAFTAVAAAVLLIVPVGYPVSGFPETIASITILTFSPTPRFPSTITSSVLLEVFNGFGDASDIFPSVTLITFHDVKADISPFVPDTF